MDENEEKLPQNEGPFKHTFAKEEKLERPDTSNRDLIDERVPITYHYLTFDTIIPKFTTSCLTNQNGSIPPQPEPEPDPPDLRKYISPFEWSESRKTFMTWLSCAITVVTAYTAGSYSAGTEQMMREWGVSEVAIYVGITTFTTGFAIAPMVLAPFSEINGRKPVFITTGILFVVGQLCCAVTRSYPGMLVARFFTGVGGSTFSTMVGGVVSDIYHTQDRNTPMCLFAGAALSGEEKLKIARFNPAKRI